MGLEEPAAAQRWGGEVKVAVGRQGSQPFGCNSLGEPPEGKTHEQNLWGGVGNGPGSSAQRHSLTRQLFFKWIKQHLRIKAFYGYSENAVKTQIRIAAPVYVLVAIVKTRLALEASPTKAYRFLA